MCGPVASWCDGSDMICRKISLELECPCGRTFFYVDHNLPAEFFVFRCPECRGPSYALFTEPNTKVRVS